MQQFTKNSTRSWIGLLGICFAQFLVGSNSSVINSAVTSISRDFDVSISSIQWLVNGYSLLAGMLVMLGGYYSDRLGRKKVFLLGLIAFSGGSVLSATSEGFDLLLMGRLLQAVSAAVILPTVLSQLEVLFSGDKLKVAYGLWGAASGLSFASGPLLGGAVTTYLNWRFIFWFNLPIAVLAFLAGSIGLVDSKGAFANRVDVRGFLVLALAIFSTNLAFDLASTHSFLSIEVTGLLMLASVLIAGFIRYERRIKAPMVHVDLFKIREFTAGNLGIWIINFMMLQLVYQSNIFLQNQLGFGYSPLWAGIALLPMSVVFLGVSISIGYFMRRYSLKTLLVLGLLLMSFGFFGVALASHSQSLILFSIPFVVIGLGMGLANSPAAVAPMQAAGSSGEVTSLTMVVRYLSSAMGVAVSSAVYAFASRDQLKYLLAESNVTKPEFRALDALVVGANKTKLLARVGVHLSEHPNFMEDARLALVSGYAKTMLLAALLGFLAALFCAMLMRSKESNH